MLPTHKQQVRDNNKLIEKCYNTIKHGLRSFPYSLQRKYDHWELQRKDKRHVQVTVCNGAL